MQSTLSRFVESSRSSWWRRILTALALLWMPVVIILALRAAIDDDLPLYSRTVLTILLVGVPFSLFALALALKVLGWKYLLLPLGAIALLLAAALYQHQMALREQARIEMLRQSCASQVAAKIRTDETDQKAVQDANPFLWKGWDAEFAVQECVNRARR